MYDRERQLGVDALDYRPDIVVTCELTRGSHKPTFRHCNYALTFLHICRPTDDSLVANGVRGCGRPTRRDRGAPYTYTTPQRLHTFSPQFCYLLPSILQKRTPHTLVYLSSATRCQALGSPAATIRHLLWSRHLDLFLENPLFSLLPLIIHYRGGFTPHGHGVRVVWVLLPCHVAARRDVDVLVLEALAGLQGHGDLPERVARGVVGCTERDGLVRVPVAQLGDVSDNLDGLAELGDDQLVKGHGDRGASDAAGAGGKGELSGLCVDGVGTGGTDGISEGELRGILASSVPRSGPE